MSVMLDAALAYAAQGRHVFPVQWPINGKCSCGQEDCGSPAKHPRTKHGLSDATANEAKIRAWWGEHPQANIGMVMGGGLLAIDIDPRKGGDESLAALGDLPDTVISLTGGGGCHLIYHVAEDHGNGTGILPGIDVRSAGGYIVAPPSMHVSGRRYEWEVGCAPGDMKPAPLPDVFKGLMRNGQRAPEVGEIIPSGERNNVLASIAGTMRRRGLEEAEIAAALLEVNANRCNPPLPDHEVRRIAASVARYPAGELASASAPQSAQTYNESEAEDAPPKTDWPEAASAEAFSGLAGDIVRTLAPHTEADPHALLADTLATFGMLVGPGPHFMVGLQRHEMRVWPVIVGPTGRGRKGLSHAEIVGVYRRAVEDFNDRLTTGLSSGEGLIGAIRDPIYRQEPIKEKGLVTGYQEVQVDAGVEDKRLLVVEAEFGRTLRVQGREGNTLSPVLRLAWDDGNLKTMTKSPVTATGAHVAIIAHITKEELLRHLDNTETASGFANRFLWIAARRSKLLPDGGKVPLSDLNGIAQGLHEALDFAAMVEEMGRDDEASALWHKVYPDLSHGKPGLFGAVVGRAEPYVMRLASVYALMNISGTVKAEHLAAALALWEYAEHSARYIFGDLTGDPMADTILRALRSQGPMTQTNISFLFGRNVDAERLAQAVSLLAEGGLIASQAVETEGRSATVWSAK